MSTEAIIGIVGALATIVGAIVGAYVQVFLSRDRKPNKGQQYKFAYIKIHHLARRTTGVAPFYKKFIQRLNTTIDVYDEVHMYRMNIFNREQPEFEIRDRSSGVIDLQILHPWQSLDFIDKGESTNPSLITQKIKKRSNTYFTRTIRINGFQPGQEDFLTRMETDVEEARMIVDFTSIPNFSAVLRSTPIAFLVRNKEQLDLGVSIPYKGMYVLERIMLKKDDIMSIKFDIDWDKIDNKLHMSEVP